MKISRSTYFILLVFIGISIPVNMYAFQISDEEERFQKLFEERNFDSLLVISHDFYESSYQKGNKRDQFLGLYYRALAESRIAFQNFDASTRELLFITQSENDPFLKAEAHKLRSDYYSRSSNRDSSIFHLQKAISVIQNEEGFLQDSLLRIKLGQYKHNLGAQYYAGQDFDEALETVMNNKEYALKIGDKDLETRSYQIISAIYSALGSYAEETNSELDIAWYMNKSKEYAQLFIERTKDLNNPYLTGFGFMMLGNIYNNEERFDSSAFYFAKSLEYVDKDQQPVSYSSRLEKIANSMHQLGNYERASEFYLEALDIAENVNNKVMEAGLANNLAFNNLKLGRITEARNYAVRSIELGLLLQRWGTVSQGYGNLSGIEKEAGNFDQALIAFEKHIQYRDSLLKEENLSRIEELETKYETEKKESEIKLLSRKNELQASQIQIRNTQFMMAGLFFTVTFLAGYIGYKRSLIKKEKENQEARQRLLSVQMNPHFLFNALIAIQHFVMRDDDPMATSLFVAKFAKVTRMVLNFSRKQLIALTDEIDLLEEFLRLQQIRADNKFTYSVKVLGDVSTDDILIPPMLTQPFIENAVEHGIMPLNDESGEIKVIFSINRDTINIVVQDNGVGISEINKGNDKVYESVSTQITKERFSLLQQITEKPFYLEINNKNDQEGKGVEVSFTIPLFNINEHKDSHLLN
jgi:tetratricopeptide (TPR) repeat protein